MTQEIKLGGKIKWKLALRRQIPKTSKILSSLTNKNTQIPNSTPLLFTNFPSMSLSLPLSIQHRLKALFSNASARERFNKVRLLISNHSLNYSRSTIDLISSSLLLMHSCNQSGLWFFIYLFVICRLLCQLNWWLIEPALLVI